MPSRPVPENDSRPATFWLSGPEIERLRLDESKVAVVELEVGFAA